MILLVDAGNSRIKWRLQRAGRPSSAGVLPTARAGELRQAWAGMQPEAALISSVAGEAVGHEIGSALAMAQAQPHWLVSPARGHGVVNHYRPPESLGSDRFAALVAAHRRAPGDWLVVGVGTALTADMLSAEGDFLGGCICPGPDLMRSALRQGTAGVESEGSMGLGAGDAMPDNTAAAVAQGIGLALAGVVQGMRQRLHERVSRPPGILLFGGARRELLPFLAAQVVEQDELVLEGLACIARDLGYDA